MGLQSVKNLLNNSILRESRFPAWQPAAPALSSLAEAARARDYLRELRHDLAAHISGRDYDVHRLIAHYTAQIDRIISHLYQRTITNPRIRLYAIGGYGAVANSSPPRTSTSCSSPRTTSPSATPSKPTSRRSGNWDWNRPTRPQRRRTQRRSSRSWTRHTKQKPKPIPPTKTSTNTSAHGSKPCMSAPTTSTSAQTASYLPTGPTPSPPMPTDRSN